MADEPEYLKALKRTHKQQKARGPEAPAGGQKKKGKGWSTAEREALRWGREVAGQDPAVRESLHGARSAILFKPKSFDDKAQPVMEGVGSREALVTRYEAATSFGDTVLGCYDIPSGRPLEVASKEGKTEFVPGKAREIPKPMTPEQMIRKAAREAAKRPVERDRDRGGRGR